MSIEADKVFISVNGMRIKEVILDDLKTPQEKALDRCHELLIYLASKPSKRVAFETKLAREILLDLGYTEAAIEAQGKILHK